MDKKKIISEFISDFNNSLKTLKKNPKGFTQKDIENALSKAYTKNIKKLKQQKISKSPFIKEEEIKTINNTSKLIKEAKKRLEEKKKEQKNFTLDTERNILEEDLVDNEGDKMIKRMEENTLRLEIGTAMMVMKLKDLGVLTRKGEPEPTTESMKDMVYKSEEIIKDMENNPSHPNRLIMKNPEEFLKNIKIITEHVKKEIEKKEINRPKKDILEEKTIEQIMRKIESEAEKISQRDIPMEKAITEDGTEITGFAITKERLMDYIIGARKIDKQTLSMLKKVMESSPDRDSTGRIVPEAITNLIKLVIIKGEEQLSEE